MSVDTYYMYNLVELLYVYMSNFGVLRVCGRLCVCVLVCVLILSLSHLQSNQWQQTVSQPPATSQQAQVLCTRERVCFRRAVCTHMHELCS